MFQGKELLLLRKRNTLLATLRCEYAFTQAWKLILASLGEQTGLSTMHDHSINSACAITRLCRNAMQIHYADLYWNPLLLVCHRISHCFLRVGISEHSHTFSFHGGRLRDATVLSNWSICNSNVAHRTLRNHGKYLYPCSKNLI